ncbi:MAG: large-conductance mechanosensitive channel protein MscL [Pseudomonadota bacterium]
MPRGLVSEFKEFAMKGSVVDMAVGIVIGGAFGTIVKSLVADIIMPPIGLLMGGVDFANIKTVLKAATEDAEAVTVNWGMFLNNVIAFLIVAWALFIVIKGMNTLRAKMEKEAELAGLKLRQSQLLTGLGFASAMIIALFAFYQYRSHRLQKSLATTRSLFLSEIHHRTKNNFQMLSSLLSLDARRAKANLTDGTGGNQTGARQDAANRARTMALVHGHLYDRGDPQTTEVDTRDFLVELLELLEDSLGRPQIMLSHDILQTRIDVDTATPLALLVCEIVTNAYKHAFDDDGGHISVRLMRSGDKLRLEIADDGRGFDPVAARQKRGSLGMHLIEDLVDQVGGQLSRSGDDGGTRWTIDNIDRRLKSISRSTELQDEAA